MNAMILDCLQNFRRFAATFGGFQLFAFRLLPYIPKALGRPLLIREQLYSVGALSLVLTVFGGLFVGMVLALQSYSTLAEFAATDSIGAFASQALLRELGPVVAALLFAGCAGSSIASEVGLMRATDQLAAMELMAVDPMQRIIAPRLIAGVISVPLLAAIFSTVGISGAYLVGTRLLGVDAGAFWAQITDRVELVQDLASGFLKSAIFGISASLVAVFEGYYSQPTAAGISRAATRTVVITSFWILLLDFILTALNVAKV